MLAKYVRNDMRGKFHVQNIFCVMWEGLKLTAVRILDVVFGQSGWSPSQDPQMQPPICEA
jgi:hypothetical protein